MGHLPDTESFAEAGSDFVRKTDLLINLSCISKTNGDLTYDKLISNILIYLKLSRQT